MWPYPIIVRVVMVNNTEFGRFHLQQKIGSPQVFFRPLWLPDSKGAVESMVCRHVHQEIWELQNQTNVSSQLKSNQECTYYTYYYFENMRPLCFGLWFIKLIKILRIALPCTYCPRPPFDICPWPKSITKHKHKTDWGSGPPVPNWPAECKRTLGHSSRRHHRHWKRNGSLCRGWKLRPKN